MKAKRYLAALLAALMLLPAVLTGCTAANDPEPETKTTDAPANTQTAKTPHDMLVAAPAPAVFVSFPEDPNQDDEWWDACVARRKAGVDPSSVADFTKTMTAILAQSCGNENLAWSPVNVYIALAMLAEVTDGETRSQIVTALGASGMDELRANVTALLTADNYDDGHTTSLMADSIWLNDDYGFKTETLERLAEIYRASSYWGDPADEEFNNALRGWLKENTRGLLDDQADGIKLTPETVLAICTAIYFKGSWGAEFSKDATREDMFHSPKGDITCDFMHKSSSSDAYYVGDGFTAVYETLNGSYNGVWFLLPDEGSSIEEMLASNGFAEILSGKASGDSGTVIDISMPKFDISSDLELIPALLEMGVEDCFDPVASDFTPLTDDTDELYVSRIKHCARVKTDEEGIEAAAFTVIWVYAGSMPPDTRIEFTLDRPFAFVLTGVTGAPLFIGVVNDPGK